MEDFVITQAIATLLFLLKDKKKAKKWLPAIAKLYRACKSILDAYDATPIETE